MSILLISASIITMSSQLQFAERLSLMLRIFPDIYLIIIPPKYNIKPWQYLWIWGRQIYLHYILLKSFFHTSNFKIKFIKLNRNFSCHSNTVWSRVYLSHHFKTLLFNFKIGIPWNLTFSLSLNSKQLSWFIVKTFDSS